MSFDRLARAASAAALALAVACGDSTGPLDLSPEELESLGYDIAAEAEMGVVNLEAGSAMGSTQPAMAVQRMVALPGIAASVNVAPRIRRQVTTQDCGIPSPAQPEDPDADGVPTTLTITYQLPECHFVDETQGFTMDMTGKVHVSDPTATAGHAFDLLIEKLKIAFSSTDGDGTVTQNGTLSVDVSAAGLAQAQNLTVTAQTTGSPSISQTVQWLANFVAAEGQTITPGQPLPDGTYSPNGTVRITHGMREATISVTTITPLQYSATCAANLANSPFSAGEIEVSFDNGQVDGVVRITYTACDFAVVQFIPAA